MTSTHVVDHIHDQPMSDVALRSVAIESLLAEKGLLTPDQVQQQVNRMDARTSRRRGPCRGPGLDRS